MLTDCRRDLAGMGDAYGAALVLVDRASIYADLGSWDAALECQQGAAQLLAELGQPEDLLPVMIRLGRLHQMLEQWDEAMTCYQRGAELTAQITADPAPPAGT